VAVEIYYGSMIYFSGRLFKKAEVKDSTVQLSFDHTGQGLLSNDGKPLTSFEVADFDGTFVPAEARIVGDKVIVEAFSVSSPAAIRFAWNETAQPNFFNKDGLPAAPFEVTLNKTITAKNKKD
jgi:sialate O-acetylesterase